MKRVVVLDTNVLLADPGVLLSFPNAEVVVPETVLGELDKLKTSRVDPDLRFRGREVSRMLFEFSEQGSLVGGVELPDGGYLRVAPFEADMDLPEGLASRNADDRILSTAWQVCQTEGPDCDVTLITNDLNMLLKAQTLGVEVARHDQGVESGFMRRYVVRPFQRYKVPIIILAIAVGVFAGVLVLGLIIANPSTGNAKLPEEFTQVLNQQQQAALVALQKLQENPDDPEALLTMGNFYFDLRDQALAASPPSPSAALNFAQRSVEYYDKYLATGQTDNNARADLAAAAFYTGETDRAIREVGRVLQSNPDHVQANYNLGIFLWQGRRDYKQAAAQFSKVIELTKDDPAQHSVREGAQALLQQVKKDAAAAGQSVDGTGTVQ
jgi:rRNA-processing protein FCF1